MNANKKKGLLLLTSLGTAIIAVGAITLSTAFDNTSNFLRASDKATASITFTNSVVNGTTSVSTAHTPTGGVIKCVVTNNDSSISSNYVAALKTGSVIRFYEADGVTEFTFEDVDKFSLTKSDSTTKYSFTHYYVTTTGVSGSFAWSESASQTRTPNYQNSGLDVSQFYVECTSPTSNIVYISEITINYGCTTKHLSDISIATAPTKTTYEIGEQFDPSGMVVNAIYDNDMQIATSAYTYYPNGPLTAEDTEITISYKGFTAVQAITVSETPSGSAKLSDLLVEHSYVLSGVSGMYLYEITLDFKNGIANARRCLNESGASALASFYTQEFSYSVNDNTKTITITSVGSPVQTGDIVIMASTPRLKANGNISVVVAEDAITAFTLTLYNQSGSSTVLTVTL